MNEDRPPMGDIINNFIKNWLPDVAFLCIMIAYVAKAFTSIQESGDTWKNILADGTLIMVFTVATKFLFSRKGIMMGQRQSRYKDALGGYEAQLSVIEPNIQYLSAFCARQNHDNTIDEQKKVLIRYGMNYDMFTNYLNGSKVDVTRKQRKAIRKARKVKVFALSREVLTSESKEGRRKHGVGRSIGEFMSQRGMLDIAMTILFAIILARYTVKFTEDFTWASVIWSFIQVTYFIVKGVLAMLRAYSFIVDEYVYRIVRKTSLLKEFDNTKEYYKSIVEKENTAIKENDNGTI